jgi:hypothetical protein
MEDFEFAAKLEPEGCFVLFHGSERAGIATCVSFEKIGSAISELQLETKDFSAKLGIFLPESFARISWLIEVSKLLLESMKPEAHWLTNPEIDELVPDYHAFGMEERESRAFLMDREKVHLLSYLPVIPLLCLLEHLHGLGIAAIIDHDEPVGIIRVRLDALECPLGHRRLIPGHHDDVARHA